MALTGKVEPQFGWQNQAGHLALTHMPMGIAAMTLAKKVHEQGFVQAPIPYPAVAGDPSENDPTLLRSHRDSDFALLSARDLQTQFARQKLAAREMRKRIETLSARVDDADKRYSDLEDELNVAREEILLQQNDKHALQTSLDLLVTENARLSQRLAERDTTLEQARDGLERGKAALDAAQTAHNSLNAAVDEANRKQQTADNKLEAAKFECKNLTAALDALHRKYQTESNNLKAEKIERNKLLATLDKVNHKYQTLGRKLSALQIERDGSTAALDKIKVKHRAEADELRSHLDAATSRAVVAETLVAKVREILLQKFSQLQASVETKNFEIHDLERSRMKLIDGTKMLLEIFAMRDEALARADARSQFLSERIAELETELSRSKSWEKLRTLGDGVPGVALERRSAEAAASRAAVNADDDFAGKDNPELPCLYVAETMLAATITF
jgi:chromosome segregation ATPase